MYQGLGLATCVLAFGCANSRVTDLGEGESESESEGEGEGEAEAEAESESEGESEGESGGDCFSDDDCGDTKCVVVGGWSVCQDSPTAEATSCSNPDLDTCCSSDECMDGQNGGCFNYYDYCCTACMPSSNQCFHDQCTNDADCDAGGVCVPGQTYGLFRSECSYGECASSADCPGGQCRPFTSPCCPAAPYFACVYEDSPCQTDADCPSPERCQPSSRGGTECIEPPCPS